MSRAAGSAPARAARGMATTSCCGKSCLRRIEKSQVARRIGTAVRRWSMITGLLVPAFDAGSRGMATATLGVFVWLQITHINLRFVFLFFAHITFLSLLVVFLVLGCVSRRAEKLPSPHDLLVWDQVVQTDQLIFRTLLPLSSTLPRICVLFFLRRTHVRPITTICAMRFLSRLFPQFAVFSQCLMTSSTVSYITNPINQNSCPHQFDGT
jgi:hypothetical protein